MLYLYWAIFCGCLWPVSQHMKHFGGASQAVEALLTLSAGAGYLFMLAILIRTGIAQEWERLAWLLAIAIACSAIIPILVRPFGRKVQLFSLPAIPVGIWMACLVW